jgi:hypothetical protein
LMLLPRRESPVFLMTWRAYDKAFCTWCLVLTSLLVVAMANFWLATTRQGNANYLCRSIRMTKQTYE